MIETIGEWLKAWKENNSEIEIKMASGKTYRGHINTVATQYIILKEYRDTYISIDKIESVRKIV